jgi:Tetracyclin repressor-like, C-terminal domain
MARVWRQPARLAAPPPCGSMFDAEKGDRPGPASGRRRARVLESRGRNFTLGAVAERSGSARAALSIALRLRVDWFGRLRREKLRAFRRLWTAGSEASRLGRSNRSWHVEEALDEDDAATQKAAFLVTALAHAPEMMEPVRRYCRALLDPLLSNSNEALEVRKALLAVEGIFLLRGLGFVEVSVEGRRSVLLQARDTVAGALTQRRA